MSSVWKIKLVKESTLRDYSNIKVYRAPPPGVVSGFRAVSRVSPEEDHAAAIRRNRNYQKRTNGARPREAEAERIFNKV